MKAHKFLIAGIIFLAIQVIAVLVSGFSNFESGAYGVGYLVGFFSPGIIGIIFLVIHFIKRHKAG